MKVMALVFLGLLVAGCATQERRPTLEQIEEVHLRHVGSDVHNVMFSNIRGWRPAGVRMLVIEFGPRRDYLVELAPPCEMNLRFQPMIRVINTQRGILSRFDSIQVGRDVCRVVSLRRIDMTAVRADLEQLRLDAPGVNERISEEPVGQDSGGT
jgi:hypothetical protein